MSNESKIPEKQKEHRDILTAINNDWSWTAVLAEEIIMQNDFGNIIFRTKENEFWRICPEELYCKKIASNQQEFADIQNDSEFIEDWEMKNLLIQVNSVVGDLKENEKYCLKVPAVLGGSYNIENIGKISFLELIAFSGNTANRIKNFPDGTKLKISIK
jgi:hypothetical protein